MDPIPRENMGNATSIFNLMRNIGGSMGIAAATTLLARHRQEHTSNLVSHIDAFNPQVRAHASSRCEAAFVAQGADVVTATERARLALFGMVQREAMMLSFTDIFRWLVAAVRRDAAAAAADAQPKRRGGAARRGPRTSEPLC